MVLVRARSSACATTLSRVRRAGSIVVSLRSAVGISPSPLKRLTSTLAPALKEERSLRSRSRSSIAYTVFAPWVRRNSGGCAR